MDEMDCRLARCFAAVFPMLNADDIRSADQESLAEWDSLASITLLGAIQDEFGLLELEDLEDFTSFRAIHDKLCSRVAV